MVRETLANGFTGGITIITDYAGLDRNKVRKLTENASTLGFIDKVIK